MGFVKVQHDDRRRPGWLGAGMLGLLLCGLALPVPVTGQEAALAPTSDEQQLTFSDAPLTFLIDAVSEQTGRTPLLSPGLPTVNVTLKSQGKLTVKEYLEAITQVLNMNGVSLIEEGTRFIRVVPNKQAREEHIRIRPSSEGVTLVASGDTVSQLIALKHIEISEAEAAIKPLLHSASGDVHKFEGVNTMLVTDTATNIKRVLEMIELIDQPVEAKEAPHIIDILYAKAADIKAKLEEIIADQEEQQKSTVMRQRTSGQPGVEAPPNPAGTPSVPSGVIRARRAALGLPDVAAAAAEAQGAADAERGIIRGKVKIVVDERTNRLIIITRPENMAFFKKIIDVLDVDKSPDVLVRIFRLEYASAAGDDSGSGVESMLNDLIGAQNKESGGATPAAPPSDPAATPDTARGAELRAYVERRAQERQGAAAATRTAVLRKSKVGELSSENVKILSDKRTNSLIVMASKEDMAALEEIIKSMDVMLSQVVVETVILSVNLTDSKETGISWVQKSLLMYDQKADGSRKARLGFAGSGGGSLATPTDPLTLSSAKDFGSSAAGLNYYFTLFDLNVNAVLSALASDSRTEVLSSPTVMTTDNRPASISIGEDQYFSTGQRPVSSGSQIEYVDDVTRENVGIKLTVTPRINEKKFVVMKINQSIDNVSGKQVLNGSEYPIVTKREVDAEVAVRSGDTIVLGGLVTRSDSKSRSKVPWLGDIPLLGILFRSDEKSRERKEVIVFLTPYVVDTPEQAYADAQRRLDSISGQGQGWKRGWSDSKLAAPRDLDSVSVTNAPAVTANVPEVAAPSAPWDGIDPELRKYVDGVELQHREALDKVDQNIGKELGD